MVTALRIGFLAAACLGGWSGTALGGKPGDWQAAARKVGLDPAAAPNVLAAAEQALGWRLLFDGKSLDGWKGFKLPAPAGWAVADGALARTGGGRDLMTKEQFGDCVWAAEWRISQKGNSGMFSRVLEQGDESWWTGLEMQVCHNEPGTAARHSAGAKYDMYPPTETGLPDGAYRDATVTDSAGNPTGWNRALVVAQGRKFDLWLNGVKVVTFEIGSPDWKARMEASNFYRPHPEHGEALKGHLLLQEHGTAVWYRNIKVRPLAPGQSPYLAAPVILVSPGRKDAQLWPAHPCAWRGSFGGGLGGAGLRDLLGRAVPSVGGSLYAPPATNSFGSIPWNPGDFADSSAIYQYFW